MADPLTIVATVLGVVATGIGIAGQLWPRSSAAPRETALPPPPTRSPTVPDADLDALRGRLTAVEAREERAQAKREEMAESLTRIETKLDERTTRRKDTHASREST